LRQISEAAHRGTKALAPAWRIGQRLRSQCRHLEHPSNWRPVRGWSRGTWLTVCHSTEILRIFTVTMVVGICCTLLSACGLWYDVQKIHYRLVVEVQTPKGPRSGSSVIAVIVQQNPFWDLGRPVNLSIRGEAARVQLPDGRALFALINRPGETDGGIYRLFDVFRTLINRPEYRTNGLAPDYKKQFDYLKQIKASAELRGRAQPVLVQFRNPNDPTTLQLVNPESIANVFGNGYRYVRSTITITGDPVTHEINKYLPWLSSNYSRHLLVSNTSTDDEKMTSSVTDGDFVRDVS
jgi:hypothetical protein